MSLRLLQVNLPISELDHFPDLVEGQDVLHCAAYPATDEQGMVQLVLDSSDTESVSDLLVKHFGTSSMFRITLLPVEATLPAPPEPEQNPEPKPGSQRKGMRRVSREELYEDLSRASKFNTLFVLMVALSTVVAAVGLVRDDVAIIIGAMVIAPLLGPNVGLSLAAALGDRVLAGQALKSIALGVSIASSLSIAMGVFSSFDPSVAAIASRTQPSPGDIALALSAGTAGALAFTSGVPAVVVGVMVAVALLPPLVVAGLLTGAGYYHAALGALTICLTNVTCVNLSAMGTFYALNVRPRTWWEADRARRATFRAAFAWILMLGLLLATILWGPFAGLELV